MIMNMLNRFAEAHNRLDLLETALRFIQVNFPQVSQEEEFLDLPKEHLVHFLSSDYIHIDTEFQVCPCIYSWKHKLYGLRNGEYFLHFDMLLGLPSSIQLDCSWYTNKKMLCIWNIKSYTFTAVFISEIGTSYSGM